MAMGYRSTTTSLFIAKPQPKNYSSFGGNTKRNVRLYCNKCGNQSPWADMQIRIVKEMNSHVDINPNIKNSVYYNSRDVDKAQIYNGENFMLDGWISTKFHVTGVAIAIALALISILSHPITT